MRQSWTFTDLEFFTLWEAQRQELLPLPFTFTSRVLGFEEFAEAKYHTWERMARTLDPDLRSLVAGAVQPDIRVVVDAWNQADLDKPEGIVRLLATRHGDRGCVINQVPGETYWYSGGFTVTQCSAIELADAVTAAIPDLPAGSMADVVLATKIDDDMDYSYGQSSVHDSFHDSVAERSDSFLQAPTDRVGYIEIQQARSIFGPRGLTKHRLELRDLAGDGRYIVDDQTPPVARGVDRRQLRDLMNTRIAAVVRSIKDEG
ncbi:ESX secretion-associated protein EspG [Nocardia sp. NPDC050712]|uniref:ESX secretion-associated protein EspG n=1 Tax=Nocardia sp. NPDC050712 TaxID=3155518 RepID=UPI0033DB3143